MPPRFSSCVLIRFGPARSLSLRAFSRSAVAEGRQNAVCGACLFFSFYLRYWRVELAASKKETQHKDGLQLVLSRSACYLFRSRPLRLLIKFLSTLFLSHLPRVLLWYRAVLLSACTCVACVDLHFVRIIMITNVSCFTPFSFSYSSFTPFRPILAYVTPLENGVNLEI